MSSNLTGMGYKKGKLYIKYTTPEHFICTMFDPCYECDHECEGCEYWEHVPETESVYAYKMKKKLAKKEFKMFKRLKGIKTE